MNDIYFLNNKIHYVFILTLAIVLSLYIYIRTLSFGFVADDFFLVIMDAKDALLAVTQSEHFRPFWYLSYPLVNSIAGMSAFAHHLTNLLLHIANITLAFFLFSKWVGSLRSSYIVLIWTLLPHNAYAITWIAQRNDLIMTFFILAGLLAGELGYRKTFYVSYIFALFGKVTCLFFPLIWISPWGFKKSRRDVVVGGLLLLFGLSVSAYAFRNHEFQQHLLDIGWAGRLLNYAKNIIVGWITVLIPIAAFGSIYSALSYLIMTLGIIFLIHDLPKTGVMLNRILIIVFSFSLILSMNYSIRVTYAMMLFVVAWIVLAISQSFPATLIKNKVSIIAISLLAYIIFAVPASLRVSQIFYSSEFDIRRPQVESQPVEGYDFYIWLREKQKNLLGIK